MSFMFAELIRTGVIKKSHKADPVADTDGPSLAKQSFRDECDINVMMRRYEKDQILPHVSQYEGRYGDFTEAVDFQTAFNVVQDAQRMFMTLPATIRARFDNDPGEFLEFATDDKNREELGKLGLLRPAVPEPGPASVVIVEDKTKVVAKKDD